MNPFAFLRVAAWLAAILAFCTTAVAQVRADYVVTASNLDQRVLGSEAPPGAADDDPGREELSAEESEERRWQLDRMALAALYCLIGDVPAILLSNIST